MAKHYDVFIDGIDSYQEFSYLVAEENDGYCVTESEMFGDVRQTLEELGGGHADIWDAETDELFADVEV